MKQYIGARYVPVLFNNNGSAEWVPNTYYESLTIVTYNNNSYTSSQNVAATIGNPVENPAYWTLTGNFNGFVNEIDQEVKSLQNQLSQQITLNKFKQRKHWIIISDSYGLGVLDGGGSTKSWVQMCIETLPEINIEFSGLSGGGFCTSPQSFLSELQRYNDDETVTDILVAGGYNDNVFAPDTIKQNITAFINYAKQHFVNSIVHIGVIASDSTQANVQANINNAVIPAYSSCGVSYNYIKYSPSILRDLSLMDLVHPNASGQAALAEFFMKYIKTGCDNWESSLIGFTFKDLNGNTQNTNCFLKIKNNCLYTLVNPNVYMDIQQTFIFKGSPLFEFKIGEFNNQIFLPVGTTCLMIPIQGMVYYNNNTETAPFTGYIYKDNNNNMMLKALNTKFTTDTECERLFMIINPFNMLLF